MGRLRLYVAAEPAPPPFWEKIQFLNSDGLPFRTRVKWESPYLLVDRADTESGQLTAVWSSAQHGQIAISTGTIMEREAPYVLVRELARGTLNRLRNQVALWSLAGMQMPEELAPLQKAAVQWLSKSATSAGDLEGGNRYAQLCLELALQGISVLCGSYSLQALAARQRQNNKAPILIGMQLQDALPDNSSATPILEAANTLGIAFPWKRIEAKEGQYNWSHTDKQLAWAQAHGKRVCAGPLIDWQPESIPDWLVLWDDDYENLLSMTTDYVKRVVTRYKGRVQVWNAAAKINTTPALQLNDDKRLHLAGRILQTVREIDNKTPVIMTIDQPAGEGLSDHGGELTPWQFADTLARADLGLTGVGLEYRIGFQAGEALPRDPLAFCQQLDIWTNLGIPVILFLQAAPTGATSSAVQQQRAWLADYGPTLLSKPTVQGLLWNRFSDQPNIPADQTGLGLLTATGQPKPILTVLRELKVKYGV